MQLGATMGNTVYAIGSIDLSIVSCVGAATVSIGNLAAYAGGLLQFKCGRLIPIT